MGQLSSARAAEFDNTEPKQRIKHNTEILSDFALSLVNRGLSISFNQIRLFRQLAYPDIPEADGIIVVLQMDITALMRSVRSLFLVRGSALNFEVIVHDDAVMQQSDSRLAEKLAVLIE
jgi:hypothetical protein